MGSSHFSNYGEGIEFRSNWPVQIVAANTARLVAGYYYNAALKSSVSLWAKSFNQHTQPRGDTASTTTPPGLAVTSSPGYNLITIDLMKDGDVRLTYVGDAGALYALDRSSSLTTPDWLPQATNSAGTGGMLVITNTPDPNANNFWRIRSVPKDGQLTK
jgi:hypothetical protein